MSPMAEVFKTSLASMPITDVLRLLRTPQVGVVTFFNLIGRFGTAARALDELPELARRGGRKLPLAPIDKSRVEDEIAAVEKHGARFVVYGESHYPELLQAVADPPPVITVLGHHTLWKSKPLIGIVGARNASANGCAFARTLAEQLGTSGIITVSGLARGIDTFAHKASLSTGTVAVVAGGIDKIYPPENKALFEQIAESGAIISEQPFGMAPISTSFPSRNRIIAGMSHGCVIVEAALKSGSLITARLAGEYDREVFAVPGSPMDPRAQGCNKLLKEGAHLVENVQDILSILSTFSPRVLLNEHLHGVCYDADTVDISTAEAERVRTLVIEKLSVAPIGIDLLIEMTGLTAGILQGVLLELELAERIKRLPGGKLSLRAE